MVLYKPHKKLERDRKTGRWIGKYEDAYTQLVEDHLAHGLSFDSFAGVIGVNQDTLFNWLKKYPAFRDARDVGFQKGLLFWERMGLAGATGKLKGFNTGAWIFNMKNRFRWRDRHELKALGPDEDFEDIPTHARIMAYIDAEPTASAGALPEVQQSTVAPQSSLPDRGQRRPARSIPRE